MAAAHDSAVGTAAVTNEASLAAGDLPKDDSINLRWIESITASDPWQANQILFECKKKTKLDKSMDAFCTRHGVAMNTVRFFFDGERIGPDDTPGDLDMEDGDAIDVVLESSLNPWWVNAGISPSMYPLPGGYMLGEYVYYIGVSDNGFLKLLHEERVPGYVVGRATAEGGAEDGDSNGLSICFPGPCTPFPVVNCPLTDLSRNPPVPPAPEPPVVAPPVEPPSSAAVAMQAKTPKRKQPMLLCLDAAVQRFDKQNAPPADALKAFFLKQKDKKLAPAPKQHPVELEAEEATTSSKAVAATADVPATTGAAAPAAAAAAPAVELAVQLTEPERQIAAALGELRGVRGEASAVRKKMKLAPASRTCLACTKGKHTAHTCGVRGKSAEQSQ